MSQPFVFQSSDNISPARMQQLAVLRQQAAELIRWVLDEVWTPRQAINRWPVGTLAESDCSLLTAYKALWHLESDEDAASQEVFYTDVQLQLLAKIYHYLHQGEALPEYMLNAYKTDSDPLFYNEMRYGMEPFLQLVTCAQRFFRLLGMTLQPWNSLPQAVEKFRNNCAPMKTQERSDLLQQGHFH